MIKHAIIRNIDRQNSVIYVRGCSLYCLSFKTSKILTECKYLGEHPEYKENELECKIKCNKK